MYLCDLIRAGNKMQFGRIFAVMQSKKGQMEAKIVHNQINLHFVLFNMAIFGYLIAERLLSFNDLRQLRVLYWCQTRRRLQWTKKIMFANNNRTLVKCLPVLGHKQGELLMRLPNHRMPNWFPQNMIKLLSNHGWARSPLSPSSRCFL